jgi:hypothetical protein
VAEINVGQQHRAYMIYPKNVQLWKLFLAKGDTSDTFEIWEGGLFGMGISILSSQKSLHIVEGLLNSQPPCGIIRTTAD